MQHLLLLVLISERGRLTGFAIYFDDEIMLYLCVDCRPHGCTEQHSIFEKPLSGGLLKVPISSKSLQSVLSDNQAHQVAITLDVDNR